MSSFGRAAVEPRIVQVESLNRSNTWAASNVAETLIPIYRELLNEVADLYDKLDGSDGRPRQRVGESPRCRPRLPGSLFGGTLLNACWG